MVGSHGQFYHSFWAKFFSYEPNLKCSHSLNNSTATEGGNQANSECIQQRLTALRSKLLHLEKQHVISSFKTKVPISDDEKLRRRIAMLEEHSGVYTEMRSEGDDSSVAHRGAASFERVASAASRVSLD